ncbi:HesB/IscA family protein [Pirellulaceae bacterium SH449]
MAVQLTERAADELKKFIADQQLPDTVALRIGVVGGGCSGFEYKLGFDENVNEEADSVRELHGIRVVVDKKSSLLLDGTEVDFHESLEKRGFVFNNPNAVKSCGCGSSFSA